jgi:hypothetical protein
MSPITSTQGADVDAPQTRPPAPAQVPPPVLPRIERELDARTAEASVVESCEEIYSVVINALDAYGMDAVHVLHDFLGTVQQELERWEPRA